MPRDESPEEAERRRQKRDLEADARHGKLADPVHIIRTGRDIVSGRDLPAGCWLYELGRWSLVARMVSDAAEAGIRAADLGPVPATVTGPGDVAYLVRIGVRGPAGWARIMPGMEAWAAAADDLERARN